MTDVTRKEIEKAIIFNGVTIKKGTELDCCKPSDGNYKVFHFIGWWWVPKIYFEACIEEKHEGNICH